MKTPHPRTSLLIWDAEDTPPNGGGYTKLLWRGYDTGGRDDVVSIPRQVEDNADRLRARYLAWIYELGETKIHGRRLVDHLGLRPGFSYWWMTLFAEKCNYAKSPQIDNAIRLMALEDWAAKRYFSGVLLTSANHQLAECIRVWCSSLGVAFEWQRQAESRLPLAWVQRAYRATPHILKALIWLPRYFINRRILIGVGLKEWQQSNGHITFFSYLFNLVPEAAQQGCFESRYWAHLPASLQGECQITNWLHLYVNHALLPSSKQAAAMIRDFNSTGRGTQHHVTLDTFLSLKVVLLTLRDWYRLQWASRGLKNRLRTKKEDGLDLLPLFEDDWQRSICGALAMSNLLNQNLFESALRCLPKQKIGVYLQENQGWEFSLIHAWQRAEHGRIIGAPHSTVRFWDLRYFFDPRSYVRTGRNDLPLPNQVAFNGLAMLDAYRSGGYPVDELIEVEALRYLHLSETNAEMRSANVSNNGGMRLLVLGDYLPSSTQQQMALLVKAAPMLPAGTVITVKPHPACPIQPSDYPGLSMTVTHEPIAKLLSECDVAYSSAVTSAAVDAYCAGVPIVSVFDPNTVNFSPLRGRKGALFASTPEGLTTALNSAASDRRSSKGPIDFFRIDNELPRWRKLLLRSTSIEPPIGRLSKYSQVGPGSDRLDR